MFSLLVKHLYTVFLIRFWMNLRLPSHKAAEDLDGSVLEELDRELVNCVHNHAPIMSVGAIVKIAICTWYDQRKTRMKDRCNRTLIGHPEVTAPAYSSKKI
jgi:hypothetical protein